MAAMRGNPVPVCRRTDSSRAHDPLGSRLPPGSRRERRLRVPWIVGRSYRARDDDVIARRHL